MGDIFIHKKLYILYKNYFSLGKYNTREKSQLLFSRIILNFQYLNFFKLPVAAKFLEFCMKKMMNLRWKLFMLHPLCWKQEGQIHFVILKQVLYSFGIYIYSFLLSKQKSAIIQSYGQHWLFYSLSKDGLLSVTEVDF